MDCLVTGGAGFIGSHLCDRLLAEGHTVLALDNFITGSRNNIAHLKRNANFTFQEHDCTTPIQLTHKVDAIFHFASPASPPKYQQYPIETLLVNSIGTYHFLEIARYWEAKFIFASTSEVYGDPLEHPQKETYWGNVNPNGPRSCYDESKRVGESFVANYTKKYHMDGRIVRIFNTYGPRMDIADGRVVTNFIKQILDHKPIILYGDGSQTRSFCYVTDLVDGIYKLATVDAAQGEVINIGNPHEQTIKEFADFLSQLNNYTKPYDYQPLPIDDPLRRKPDITKAQQLLHWEPKVSLAQGLADTMVYFKQL